MATSLTIAPPYGPVTSEGPCPCCASRACYRVTGNSTSGGGGDCCADGGCCNYGDGPIDETLTGGPDSWSLLGAGPVGTSNWSLVRSPGSGPLYTWTLTNDCQNGCHPGAYMGTAQWDGQGSHVFPMGNYRSLTVTKVSCP